MPFATGTARTPSELLKAINTLLTANGWTKLRGEEDMNCAAPKAARYWRVVVFEIQTTTNDFPGVQRLHLRTTIGGANVATNGANWSLNSLGTGNTGLLVSGGNVRAADIDDGPWILTYDFGSATTIREIEMQADTTVGNTPRDFSVQWSNDGITWTTMAQFTAPTWTASQVRQFSWADGTRYSRHVADDAPRRTGTYGAWTDFTTQWSATSFHREMSNDTWIWQGPGYDASRRVYIHARGMCRETSDTHMISFGYATAHDNAILGFNNQAGSPTVDRTLLMNSGTINYWIYCNSKRLIVVVRSGAQDYTSAYVGFMSAFATPDQWPFPLAVTTTSLDDSTYVFGDNNARLSSAADPGLNAGVCRLWDGTQLAISNRPNNVASNLYLENGFTWVSPYHYGCTGRGDWPQDHAGDWVDYLGHFFDRIDPTVQGHLPLFPCVVQDRLYGNLGVLDGLFGIPGGGILTALQVITINGQDYRIFPNRTRREGVNWFAVRED